jgi:hypothetical protein
VYPNIRFPRSTKEMGKRGDLAIETKMRREWSIE